MGHIKEPDGVDFIIKGKPLTEKEKKAISEFIKADKKRIAKQKARRTSVAKRTKKVIA
ncbi:MAG: hypothetical protein M0Q26_08585 [Chitinophagaceae bacterium]|nr:hypothetical protein [Chitinophagaceae bacterium]